MARKIVMQYACRECDKKMSLESIPGVIKLKTLNYYNELFLNELCPDCYETMKTNFQQNIIPELALNIN